MPNEQTDLEVSNPTLGSLKIRGTDWIGIVTLLVTLFIGANFYTNAAEMRMQNGTLLTVLKDIVETQRDANKQSKFMACIVSRPEAERKREFEYENSFCQRFSRP